MLETSLIVLILIGDQLKKYLTERFLPLGASYPLWEGVFEFTNVHNTGAAWGMFSGGRAFFIVITVIVCSLMLALLAKKRRELGRLARVCLSLLIAGAAGNLIDRVILGYVRDMLNFSLINFPVFNVADSAVCIGAALLVIDVLFSKKGSVFSVLESRKAGGEERLEKAPAAGPEASLEEAAAAETQRAAEAGAEEDSDAD